MPAAQEVNNYEDDRSNSEVDSDFENDPVVRDARNSTEVADHDREILVEEEEREKLLANGGRQNDPAPRGFFTRKQEKESPSQTDIKESRRKARRSRKRRKHGRHGSHDEEGELMFEMEEGGPTDDTSSHASSSSAELDKLNRPRSSISKRQKFALWHVVAIAIASLFALLTFGAYKLSRTSHRTPAKSLLSNGTSNFAPTTILISLDGFRADFLHRDITPTLNQFIAEGVSPRYMIPSFPSVTFPNHYTLVTGLYPESHGVVGNTFWDPNLQEQFHNTDPAMSMVPKWWAGGEPLWVTAEKRHIKTAIHMWPGSEAGMDFGATYLDKFNGSEVLSRKTERILELLDMRSIEEETAFSQRPQFIAAYVPNVDSDGHKYGPNSTEIWDTISSVDAMLHNIFIGLEERNLTNLVNVVVVSDHGMATTSTDRLIQLDDLIDLNLVEHIDGWPLYGLRPKNPIDLRGLYDRLLVESQGSGKFEVYLKDEDMPERYHFSKSDRIAPLWVIPRAGWAIVHKEDFDVKEAKAKGEMYHPKGLHGYDHENPLMRAIFVARGPAFPHKPNSRLEVFQNTEVYNIICDSLGIEPRPNNGTLRLPLKPVGLHSDESSSTEDDPTDLPVETSSGDTTTEEDADEESKEAFNAFWTFVKTKMAAAQAWASKVMANLKKNQKKPVQNGESFEQGDSPP